MSIYLIRGPIMGKGNREYVICEVNGKRRKINYAKYLVLKSGIPVSKHEEVHHKDKNKHNNDIRNLCVLKEYKHKQEHKKKGKKRK